MNTTFTDEASHLELCNKIQDKFNKIYNTKNKNSKFYFITTIDINKKYIVNKRWDVLKRTLNTIKHHIDFKLQKIGVKTPELILVFPLIENLKENRWGFEFMIYYG